MNLQVTVDTHNFTMAMQQCVALTGQNISAVVKDQARLLAKRLQDLTFPKTAAVGKKRVAIDLGKVYLQNDWFESKFAFKSKPLGDRVKELVQQKDTTALEKVFSHTSKLRQVRAETFDKGKLGAVRGKNGRVPKNWHPFSFPVDQQKQVGQLQKAQQSRVGKAKSGWAACSKQLGGNAPAWLSKPTGTVQDNSAHPTDASITLTNEVSYFAAIDRSANIVSRAMQGRATDMLKAAQNAVQRALAASNVKP